MNYQTEEPIDRGFDLQELLNAPTLLMGEAFDLQETISIIKSIREAHDIGLLVRPAVKALVQHFNVDVRGTRSPLARLDLVEKHLTVRTRLGLPAVRPSGG